MFDLDARAGTAIDFRVRELDDFALAKLQIVLTHFNQPLDQCPKTEKGDRIAVVTHGQHPIRGKKDLANQCLRSAARMSAKLVVIHPVHIDNFLSFFAVGSEEVEVHAERLVPHLGKQVLSFQQLAVHPLPLDQRTGVVVNLAIDAVQPLTCVFQHRH